MKNRSNFAVPALRRGLAAITTLTALAAIVVASHSSAQQPAPKAPPKAQQKAQPKDQQKDQQKAAPAEAPQQQNESPQVIYTPWTKVCQTGPDGKKVCFTGKGGRVESGIPVVGAVVIEPEGEGKKLLRVTLPLGVALPPGTRVIIDQGQPMMGPYVICVAAGCMADYEASDELLARMKASQSLHVQGINEAGQPISIPLPLTDFAKAYDAPPTDPKKVEEQQKQLQDELQKRAEEARKRLEGQQPAPAR
jgi:invasion protein IalB